MIITTHTNDIQRIIREAFKTYSLNKLENIGEMDKFLDAFGHPKLNQENVNHLIGSITSSDFEEKKLKILPTKKSPGLHEFTAEST
jgi:hypothetical protein